MAQRRMFSPEIICSDEFLDMPPTSRDLYIQLAIRADDDGFIQPKTIMKILGSADDDIKILLAKRFILPFESGVVVIKHWLIHNMIRNDRYKPTRFQEERKMLQIKENKAYTELLATNRQPNGNQMAPQVRLGKVRLGKDSKEYSDEVAGVQEVMEVFAEYNPTINWGNKTTRKAAASLIKQFGLEGTVAMAKQVISVQGKKYAPVAVTPYQMKEKLAQFKAYFESERNKKPKVAEI